METLKPRITVETTIKAPVRKVWEFWTLPGHITQWNHASDDWHSPRATNDLHTGGSFSARMEAKDGSMGFDFGGIYDDVRQYERIDYTMDDGRKVSVIFKDDGDATHIEETLDPENTFSLEMQKSGWQAILDNFKRYVETH